MITIGIDSAMHKVGACVIEDNVLINTKLLKVPNKYKGKECVFKMAHEIFYYIHETTKNICQPIEVVIEDHEYRYGNEKMKVSSFADMYSVGVCVASSLSAWAIPVVFYKPREWKGTVPKAIKTARIMEEEIKLGSSYDLLQDGQDDIIDAIGLARFHIDKIR